MLLPSPITLFNYLELLEYLTVKCLPVLSPEGLHILPSRREVPLRDNWWTNKENPPPGIGTDGFWVSLGDVMAALWGLLREVGVRKGGARLEEP